MSDIGRRDPGIGKLVGPYDMSAKNPALGKVKWYTSYTMGPYKESGVTDFTDGSNFAPLLKLRWVKSGERGEKHESESNYFYRLVVQMEYPERFFLPVFFEEKSGKEVRPDIQVKFMGKTIMVMIGFIAYTDANLPIPKAPKTEEDIKLDKFSRFIFDFDAGVSELIRSSSIYVSCVYGDPEESTISKVIVEDVDEL